MIIEQIILASDFLNGIIDRGEINPNFWNNGSYYCSTFGALVSCFTMNSKNKNETIIEISKYLDDAFSSRRVNKNF